MDFSAASLRLDVPYPKAVVRNLKETTSRFRTDRLFRHLIPLISAIHARKGAVRILDIGGSAPYWGPASRELERMNCEITLLNLDERRGYASAVAGNMHYEQGDGRHIDHPDNAFDLVHSSSVIEHVGDGGGVSWLHIRAAANEIRRLAPSYYVQTPNFWFPYEPHHKRFFIHWLPEQLRARWLMRAECGYPKAPTMLHAVEWVQRQRLLDVKEMAALFPDARIEREKFFGLTKSVMAIKA